MKRWLGIGLAIALLGAFTPTTVLAEGTCIGKPAANGTCQGVFLGRDLAGRGFLYLGDGTNRMYIWSSNRTATTGPDSYVGRTLVSHEDTVESGVSDLNIRRGNITLTDSMGVPIN